MLLAQARGQAGGEQRMPAQLEEVIVRLQGRGAQHFAHQPGDLLHRCIRRCGRRRCGGRGRCRHRHLWRGRGCRGGRHRQRLAIDLAVGQQGQLRHRDELRRDHVVRQVLLQVGAQRGRLQRGARGRHGVGHQAHVAGLVLARDDHAARDAGGRVELGLDLAELNAVAAHLDLVVQPAHVVESPVLAPAAEVAGAVQARTGLLGERVGEEALGGQVGAVPVAAGYARAADADLARLADGAAAALLVEDPDRGVGDRAADGDVVGARDRHDGRPDGGLGRAVHVPQRHAGVEQAARQRGRQRLAAAQGTEAGRCLPAFVEQQVPGGRRGLHDGDAVLRDQRGQRLAVHRVLALGQDGAGAGDQRQQQLEHGYVERQRGHGQQPVVRAQPRFALHAGEEVDDAALQHHHALGLAGGAGGVDHVGRRGGVGQGEQRGVGRRGDRCLVLVDAQLPFARQVDQLGMAGLGDHHAEAGVLLHVLQALAREVRIQRHIGGTGLQHGQQRGQQVHAAAQAQADPLAAADAARVQQLRDAVGPGFELAVGELASLGLDGDAVRGLRGLGADPLLDARMRRQRRGGGGVPLEQARVDGRCGGSSDRQLQAVGQGGAHGL